MRIPVLLITCLVITFHSSMAHPQFLNLPKFPPPVDVKVNPKSTQAKPNLETTVEEVESILKYNPNLPRLTRGEILDLLENITREDSKRDPKAVMLVMPYTPEGDGNEKNMEELYTKPPVTHIIGPRVNEESRVKNSVNEIGNEALDTKPTKTRGRPFRKNPTVTTSTTTTTSSPPQRDSTPVQFVEKSRRRRPPTPRTSTTTTTSTAQPEVTHPRRRPTRRRPTTFRYSNHKYPDDSSTSSTTLPSNGIRVINPPKLDPGTINEDLLMTEDRRNEVVVGSPSVEFDDEGGSYEESYDYNKDPTKKPVKKYQPSPSLPSSLETSKLQEMLSFLATLPTSTTTTTTTSIPDISNVADNLSPDMRELLMNFGLIPDPKETDAGASDAVESYSQDKPEVKPESYVGFKPLPDDDASKSEMDELLARFGLGRTVRQEERSKVKKDHGGMSMEMVPEEFKGVLEDIGLTTREGKKIRAEALASNLPSQEKHVFSPQKTHNVSRVEIEKLKTLIGIFKQLGNGNGSSNISDIDQNELKQIITSLNDANGMVPLDEQPAPNPLQYDHGLSKNEVKRQEGTSTTITTITTVTEVPTVRAEVEDKGPSLKDLEDSFGGSTEPSTTTTTEQAPETTTGLRRTGFYHLVDWNTFLDIDDQKGKRVNLRFQPTIGDPKRFYSISVP